MHRTTVATGSPQPGGFHLYMVASNNGDGKMCKERRTDGVCMIPLDQRGTHMPRGIPRSKSENGGPAGDKDLSKMEGVRRALNELGPDAMPADIISYVKRKFDMDLSATMASSYKSSISRKGAGKSGMVRKSRGPAPAAASAAAPAPSPRIS